MNNIHKSGCGAMKFLKISAVGMMLLSVGSTYAFNPVEAQAKTNGDDGKREATTGNGLTAKDKERIAENAKVEAMMQKLEEEHPIVEGATITKYTYVSGNDYVKNGKFYKVYRVNWTKTSKVSYAGVAVRTATSAEVVLYSTSGNHVDSKAKLTSQQKKIISSLKKSKTYSKQYRYIAVYESRYKWTKLYVIPNSGKKAIDELYNHTDYSFDSHENIALAIPSKKSPLKSKVKIAYDLNVLPHVDTEKAWYHAFVYGSSKKGGFHGYLMDELIAIKSKHA